MSNAAVYEKITNAIIASLESGNIPWIKPWKASNTVNYNVPHNVISKKSYRGINRLYLSCMMNYTSNTWGTFKQWKSIGASVRKGEKGTEVVYFQPIVVKSAKNENEEDKVFPLLKTYYVFNADQVEGYVAPVVELSEEEKMANNQQVNAFIESVGANIRHGGDEAYFSPSLDYIQMPVVSSFISEDAYYGVLFHELTHWTGHKTRLDRLNLGKFGSSEYAFEELVAELGSAFLSQNMSINSDQLRHAGYIQGWVKCLKEHKNAIFRAAALAQTAVDYLTSTKEEGDYDE